MRRILHRVAAMLLAVAVGFVLPVFSQAEGLYISASSAAVMVVGSGELLYAKDAYTQRPMASTTKIMTALLALEEQTPQREITATDAMVRVEGTSMGLQAGDKVTLSALAYGMLLESGNDAANTVALALSGSEEKFAALMNARAKALGMKKTHFVTPSGLDAPGHCSTAYDMALLGCAALQNPDFAAICKKQSARIQFGNPPQEQTVYNHNRLLRSYEGALGIKTGFTKKSGRCLVSAAQRGGVTLVAVTLRAPNDWDDHKKLLDYGFSQVKEHGLDSELSGIALPVVGGTAQNVRLSCGIKPVWDAKELPGKVTREIRLRHFEYAPLKKGQVVGEARYLANGKLLCAVPIVAAQAVAQCNIEPEPPPETTRPQLWDKLLQKVKG